MTTKHQLSKSSFIKGIQCPKQLYLYKHNYNLMDKVSDQQQAIFDRGHEVGRLAQAIFANGINAELSPRQYQQAVKYTKQLLDNGEKVIYEAAFIYDGVLVISDIVVGDNEKLKIYEVKSSTSVSDTNVLDGSIQYYVLNGLGYKVTDVSIVYLNNQYVRMGDIDVNELFTIHSIIDEVKSSQNLISEYVDEFKDLLNQPSIPDIDIGTQCFSPYNCSFLGYCWKHIPEKSVFDIASLRKNKMFDLYNAGQVTYEDIDGSTYLNDKQQQQVDCELNQLTVIDKVRLREFINSLNYPLSFLDFETIMPAVPLFDNSRPYQQIPFQYSLHIKSTADSNMIHEEFLAEASGDPRPEFIKSLTDNIPESGDILVYNLSFEKKRLLELAEIFPADKDTIEKLIKRMKDLMIPFKDRWYYTPEMQGSYSIKYVLPALVPEMDYSQLEIQEGGTASSTFEKLYNTYNETNIDQIREDLLKYCEMDTLAMVKILENIKSLFC